MVITARHPFITDQKTGCGIKISKFQLRPKIVSSKIEIELKSISDIINESYKRCTKIGVSGLERRSAVNCSNNYGLTM